jgi:ABC-type antimicrobial peptide transport system permease subunit
MAIGVTAGLTICFWSATLVEDLVYDLPARDLATLAGSALVLVAIGVAASWMPVRRAARIDPIRVLRES